MQFPRTLSFLLPALFAVACACSATQARAQAVVAVQNCGVAGSAFTLKTNNWQRKFGKRQWTVKYSVIWDRSVLLGSVQQGYQASFEITRNVPPTAPLGPHEVQIEQIETSRDLSQLQITACRSVPFTVGTSSADPWATALTPDTNGVGLGRMNIKFDPTGACAVPECSSIYLIQVGTITVVTTANDSSQVSPGQIAFTNQPGLREQLGNDTDPTYDTFVDELVGSRDPYMNGRDHGDNGHAGRQSQSSGPSASTSFDTPNLNLAPGIARIKVTFEVNAFCESGASRGEFLGKTYWQYQRLAGSSVGQVYSLNQSDLQPRTAGFWAALQRYCTNHGFPLPKPKPPSSGGSKCTQFPLP